MSEKSKKENTKKEETKNKVSSNSNSRPSLEKRMGILERKVDLICDHIGLRV